MRKFIVSATLVAALNSTALAQSVGEKTGVNSALGIAPKTEDFVKEAATSGMLEIDSAKIAQQKGNADEKQFAQQMMTGHTKTSSELKNLVPADMKSVLPTALDDARKRSSTSCAMRRVKISRGQYEPMQVSAHKEAVSLFERYAKGGQDPKLKDWAGQTLPALQHHLEMAQALDKIASNSPAYYARG